MTGIFTFTYVHHTLQNTEVAPFLEICFSVFVDSLVFLYLVLGCSFQFGTDFAYTLDEEL